MLKVRQKVQAVNFPMMLILVLIRMLTVWSCRVIMVMSVAVALQVAMTSMIISIRTRLIAWTICKITINKVLRASIR